jgi:RimJ/RimL family protein N-acetyltransferase
MPVVEMTTAGLLLRPWRSADAAAVHRACQDPEIQRWTAVPRPYRMADAEALVDASAAAWAAGTGAPLGVFDQVTGELLGSCAVTGIREHTGWLGYWTAPVARGRGVAVHAARAVSTFAFHRLGLLRIAWQAELGNHASRMVALRTGVRIDGAWRYVRPHPRGRPQAWLGTLLPGEVSAGTPDQYASGSLVALRARIFGAAQPELPLAGAGGRLRPAQPRDVPGATAACQDPESVRWTTVPVPYTEQTARQYLFEHSPLQWAAGHGAVYTIADERGGYLGEIELTIDRSDAGCAEVGFLVAPWARGRGYATAALRTVCSWGFDVLRLQRIVWRAHLGNDASRRVAERAGFTIEGVQRAGCVQRGERRDAWVGALVR